MKQYDFGIGRFFFGLFMIVMGLYRSIGIYTMREIGAEQIIGIVIGVIGILIFYSSFRIPLYFCSDCGQFLGRSGTSCPRCGCNIFTTEFKGTGQTMRDGGKNY
jgi:hypothetical protein